MITLDALQQYRYKNNHAISNSQRKYSPQNRRNVPFVSFKSKIYGIRSNQLQDAITLQQENID